MRGMAVRQATEGHPLPTLKVLILNSVHFMKKLFHHETTKFRKHEICLIFFSCFRPFVIS
jgi:hypothetical protein